MSTDLLTQAIALARAGKKTEARSLLNQLLQTDKQNLTAWLWYVDTWPDDDQRIEALEQCLKFNPGNQQVQQASDKLQARRASSAQTSSLENQLSAPRHTILSKLSSQNNKIISQQTESAANQPLDHQLAPLPNFSSQEEQAIAQFVESTKKCPYCAEIIKAEAIVCRFCSRDLNTGLLPNATPPTATPKIKRPSLLDARVETLTKAGWQVINRTNESAQLKFAKQWNSGCLLLFVLLPILAGFIFPPLWGLAVLDFIFIVIAYMTSSDRSLYLTEEKLQQEELDRLSKEAEREVQQAQPQALQRKKNKQHEKPTDLRSFFIANQVWVAGILLTLMLIALAILIIYALGYDPFK